MARLWVFGAVMQVSKTSLVTYNISASSFQTDAQFEVTQDIDFARDAMK